jgi:hypothetical protein
MLESAGDGPRQLGAFRDSAFESSFLMLPETQWTRSEADCAKTSCSSIFSRRKIGSMFMRVNSKCAHQVRPPLPQFGVGLGVSTVNSGAPALSCKSTGPLDM